MKKINILSVCGSGTVTSSMVALKLTERLSEYGYEVNAVETSPNGIETAIAGTHFDLMACVSPVYEDYGIPKVNAVGMISGRDSGVIEECLKILEGIE